MRLILQKPNNAFWTTKVRTSALYGVHFRVSDSYVELNRFLISWDFYSSFMVFKASTISTLSANNVHLTKNIFARTRKHISPSYSTGFVLFWALHIQWLPMSFH